MDYRIKGNEKQKIIRIAEKVAGILGSRIDSAAVRKRRRPKQTPVVYQIKVTLKGIDPPIWRRIQTRDCTLDDLHALLQIATGWEFEHCYSFKIGGVEFSDQDAMYDEEIQDAFDTKLSDVIPAHNRRPRFEYAYDFGDDWVHQLIVEERLQPEPGMKYPVCVAGARACPPENCGGSWGYADFVEAVHDPKHRRHEEFVEWLGDEFDPEAFDAKKVTREMRKVK